MLDDPDYRELYARWIQFGTFCPMMRSHGEGAPREIYQFGKKGEPIYDAIEKYIRLRYSLLPYIYTTAWEVTANQSSCVPWQWILPTIATCGTSTISICLANPYWYAL